MSLFRVFLSILCPPLAVFDKGCGSIIIVFILWLCGWVPDQGSSAARGFPALRGAGLVGACRHPSAWQARQPGTVRELQWYSGVYSTVYTTVCSTVFTTIYRTVYSTEEEDVKPRGAPRGPNPRLFLCTTY